MFSTHREGSASEETLPDHQASQGNRGQPGFFSGGGAIEGKEREGEKEGEEDRERERVFASLFVVVDIGSGRRTIC